MKYTNNLNLPEGLYNVLSNDEYNKGNADYSANGLVTPPQIMNLMRLHKDELTTDVSENIFSILGAAVHYILLMGGNKGIAIKKALSIIADDRLHYEGYHKDDIDWKPTIDAVFEVLDTKNNADYVLTEERYYVDVAGITISGKPDWIDNKLGVIEDYKVTSVWKYMNKDYSDWEAVQNIYRYILHANGLPINELKINMILRDWKRGDYLKRKDEGYPSVPFAQISLPVWELIDTLQFIIDQIRRQKAAILSFGTPSFGIFQCTPKDRWAQPDKWAVQKKETKRATAVFDDEEKACYDFNIRGGTDAGYEVVKRPGYSLRCEEYCSVSQFCQQHASNQIKSEVEQQQTTFDLISRGVPSGEKPELSIGDDIITKPIEVTPVGTVSEPVVNEPSKFRIPQPEDFPIGSLQRIALEKQNDISKRILNKVISKPKIATIGGSAVESLRERLNKHKEDKSSVSTLSNALEVIENLPSKPSADALLDAFDKDGIVEVRQEIIAVPKEEKGKLDIGDIDINTLLS